MAEVVGIGLTRDFKPTIDDPEFAKALLDEAASKLDRLRLSIKEGVAALDRGDYDEIEDELLDAYFDGLAAPSRC